MSENASGDGMVHTDPSLIGVRGWLLLLCVSMSILTPLLSVVSLATSWPEERMLQMFNLRAALYIATAFEISIQAFVCYAGIRLWTVAPGAVSTAKLALGLAMGFAAIEPLLLIAIAQAPPQFASGVWEASVPTIAKMAVYVAIWMTYLFVSKRVAATYR